MQLFIEDLHAEKPPQLIDFGVGDAPYKRSFANVECDAASVYLTPHYRWRFVLTTQRALHALERGVRRLLITLRLDRVIRKLLKRQR